MLWRITYIWWKLCLGLFLALTLLIGVPTVIGTIFEGGAPIMIAASAMIAALATFLASPFLLGIAWLTFDRYAPRVPGDLRCRGCGYDLAGVPGPICPECGRLDRPPARVEPDRA